MEKTTKWRSTVLACALLFLLVPGVYASGRELAAQLQAYAVSGAIPAALALIGQALILGGMWFGSRGFAAAGGVLLTAARAVTAAMTPGTEALLRLAAAALLTAALLCSIGGRRKALTLALGIPSALALAGACVLAVNAQYNDALIDWDKTFSWVSAASRVAADALPCCALCLCLAQKKCEPFADNCRVTGPVLFQSLGTALLVMTVHGMLQGDYLTRHSTVLAAFTAIYFALGLLSALASVAANMLRVHRSDAQGHSVGAHLLRVLCGIGIVSAAAAAIGVGAGLVWKAERLGLTPRTLPLGCAGCAVLGALGVCFFLGLMRAANAMARHGMWNNGLLTVTAALLGLVAAAVCAGLILLPRFIDSSYYFIMENILTGFSLDTVLAAAFAGCTAVKLLLLAVSGHRA